MTARVDLLGDIGTRQRVSAQPAAIGLPFVRLGFTVHRAASDTATLAAGSSVTDASLYSFSVLPLDSIGTMATDTALIAGRRYYVIRSWAPRASSVRIRGDFTEWKSVELTRRSGGLWEVRLPLDPGVHFLSVQVNGGEWSVPPGMAKGISDYDSQVGVFLTIAATGDRHD